MSISNTDNNNGQQHQSKHPPIPISTSTSTSTSTSSKSSKFLNLIRRHMLHTTTTMRGLLLKDRCKITQVHALNNPTSTSSDPITINSMLLSSKNTTTAASASTPETTLLPCGIPTTDLLEPPIDPHLKYVDFVHSLSDIYRRIQSCPSGFVKLQLYLEQYSLFCSLRDTKLLRRCIQSARQHAVDVHSKVVLSSWLRYQRREDEVVGSTPAFGCAGRVFECPHKSLVHGYDPNLGSDHCRCCSEKRETDSGVDVPIGCDSDSSDDDIVCFLVGSEEVYCIRPKIAALSSPLESMLYGGFVESRKDRIDFSKIGITLEGMKAVDFFSRTRKLDHFSPEIVLGILCFANQFCCEEMKSACEAYFASLISNVEEALVLIDYGLEERASLLVGSCLQVLLRELPSSLHSAKVRSVFCSSEARERLAVVGHASFLLYYFLSQVALEERLPLDMTIQLLERLRECATDRWQKALANHQMGCLLLEKKEYKDAQICFEAAVETGHVYSVVGVARAKHHLGLRLSAYELINNLISEYKPIGWLYQERSLYNVGRKKIMDLDNATALDPTLSFPFKYRAVAMAETNEVEKAISEINKIIRFKLSPDCLELRAWFFITLGDYEAALKDIQALLTLEPDYMMFHGKMRGDHLVELLSQHVRQWSPADCWLQLYDRWSSIDDIGSLAVIHQMLVNDPEKSLLRFRQSLLLLRLNCQKAAMRSLRLARNHSSSEYEKLVYEGWILYDTGHREEALSKAEESISMQRSFEAFFLKAYTLADTTLDPESSSNVIQLLKDALLCPSDGLRKGQALNNLGSVYVDCGKLDLAADCYVNALDIKHTRAHQGLARVYHLKGERKAAYDEMTKLIEKAQNNASACEKRSEYCDRDMANDDLSMATRLDPLRTYPYRYRAAVLMDDQRETEAVEELNRAIVFKPDLQMLHLRAAFHESLSEFVPALRDCEAALCLDPNHKDTLDLYSRIRSQCTQMHT